MHPLSSRAASQLVVADDTAPVLGRPWADAQALDPTVARSRVGLTNVPTVLAMGPFDDLGHADHVTAAFATVQRFCSAQLVLLGEASSHRWLNMVGAADVLVPSTPSGPTGVLAALSAGRAVVAPADPVTVALIVPSSAGLVYRRGDIRGIARALIRLLTKPDLRAGMASRAIEVARRHNGGKKYE